VNNEKEICKEIGNKLKNLRISNGYSSYENFAVEHDLSRMQYWRIEKGLTNITIRSLIKLLNIHKITIEDFFLNMYIYKMDGKIYKADGKLYKSDGKLYSQDGKASVKLKTDGQLKKSNNK
jgi:transcriptional regulator with XRE-family HTH domain